MILAKLFCLLPVMSLVGALSPFALLAVTSAVAGSKSLSWQESPAVLQRLLRPVPDTLQTVYMVANTDSSQETTTDWPLLVYRTFCGGQGAARGTAQKDPEQGQECVLPQWVRQMQTLCCADTSSNFSDIQRAQPIYLTNHMDRITIVSNKSLHNKNLYKKTIYKTVVILYHDKIVLVMEITGSKQQYCKFSAIKIKKQFVDINDTFMFFVSFSSIYIFI